jgi:hypothetical protein
MSTALATVSDAADFKPRDVSMREQTIVGDIMREFSEMTTWRNVFAGQLEEAAQLIWPEHRNTFYYGNWLWPGSKKTDNQVDATGMLALHRFAAIADSLLTPANSEWHKLEASDDYVMQDRDTRLWFEQVTKLVHRYRNNAMANFRGQNAANYMSLGAFGNSVMYIDAFDAKYHRGYSGLRYKAVPLGECFFGENHQGQVDRVFRWFRMTAYQALQKFGPDYFPSQLMTPLKNGSQWRFSFIHCVKPREDFDPERLDYRALPFTSWYVSIDGQCLMAPPGGYKTFPYAISRYMQAPNEVYGRGPAQLVLPALKTLNAQKRMFLKQGHRAADPVLLMSADGILGMDLKPGAKNAGGVNKDGKPLVHVLPTGNIQIAIEMMQEERGIIDDVFLVSLFKVLSEHPDMTATQVIELVNEKGILVAPTLGRQETEYLEPMVGRELSVLSQLGKLPPMPPRLREAGGNYEVVFTSPLALSRAAGKASGFVRTVETVKEIVNITQDPSYLDPFNFNVAIPEIAKIQNVPESWMDDAQGIAAKRKQRAQSQQRQEQIQAMPAQAAMIKAQAAVAKNQPGLGTQGLGGPQGQAA